MNRLVQKIGILIIFIPQILDSQVIFQNPLSQRIANYDIRVKLDPEKKMLTGKMLLHWQNPSNDTIRELQFHTYLNAFKNTRSTFITEGGGHFRGQSFDDAAENQWGWIDILSMKRVNGDYLTKDIKYIQPDDNSKYDQTVISIKLNDPVLPKESADLEIEFKSKLPKIFARTGYSDNYYFVGQWFPKIGVYEVPGQRFAKKGQWNCHQFHQNSEFYADFGVYNVDITVPKNFIVGATGVQQKIVNNNDNTKTCSYRAEDVIDFAWTASPRFVLVEDEWEHIKIKLYLQPEHKNMADRYLKSVKSALSYFALSLGKYPYPVISIIDPPMKGLNSGGMEYPMLITGGSFAWMPEGLRFIEMVTIHEFGHQYFMALLASNEFEEAFLDEGFTTYFETKIMDATYGVGSSFVDIFGLRIGDFESQRIGYVKAKNPKIAESYRYSWEFRHNEYGFVTYNKPAVWLTTLEGMLGKATMGEIMKTFYERWKFKHPCINDFIDIVNEIAPKKFSAKYGKDMNWFFNQVLYKSDICDYKLASVSNQAINESAGMFDKEGTKEYLKLDLSDKPNITYSSKVVIQRLGEIAIPVDVLIHFDNGEEKLETWDGKARAFDFTYTSKHKIIWAKIDPENKILMDVNLSNNSITLEPETSPVWKYTLKFLFWVQNIMQTVSFFA